MSLVLLVWINLMHSYSRTEGRILQTQSKKHNWRHSLK